MTVQLSDKIDNKFKDVDFGKLALYAICVGDIYSDYGWGELYPFTAVAKPRAPGTCSALWSGFISCYVLNEQGEITLDRFEYPFEKDHAPDLVNETLEGDFWLIMKSNFFGDKNYIPFVQGRIVADRSKWKIRDRGNPQSSREALDKIFSDVNKSALLLIIDSETAGNVSDFKVYIDGNVNFTHTDKDTPPPNGHLIRIPAGRRRIIVREFDHTKPDRKESNTIYFDAVENQTHSLRLIGQDDRLILSENT